MADKAVASDSVGSVLWRTAPAGALSALRCLSDLARSLVFLFQVSWLAAHSLLLSFLEGLPQTLCSSVVCRLAASLTEKTYAVTHKAYTLVLG